MILEGLAPPGRRRRRAPARDRRRGPVGGGPFAGSRAEGDPNPDPQGGRPQNGKGPLTVLNTASLAIEVWTPF